MEPLKLSIVTPSFNQGRYIEDAILSVMNQGYRNFEHIIYDNCSTDNTAAVARRYPHVTFVSEPDKGQSDAINKGFLHASGDIIGWLNADDYYLPDTFHKIALVFANPTTDAVYSNVKFVNAQGEHLRNLTSHRPLKWLAFLYTFIQSTSLFFRKEVIDNNILLDVDLNLCMDQEFFVNMLYHGYQFKHINDYFAAFRRHDSNKSLLSDEVRRGNALEGIKIINKHTRLNLRADKATILAFHLCHNLIAKPVRGMLKLLPSSKVIQPGRVVRTEQAASG